MTADGPSAATPDGVALIQYINRIQFGRGARAVVPGELARLGVRRPLVVSDHGVAAVGIVDQVTATLAPDVATYLDVQSNPTEAQVLAGLETYRAGGCDGVVAVGGGSVLDAAKCIALLDAHGGRMSDYVAVAGDSGAIGGPIAPVVAVPTTTGTGSEAGRGAGLTLTDGRKAILLSVHLVPRVAVCDPELTMGLPPGLTAATGIDAISHCVEAFLSPKINPPADAVSLDGLARLLANLPRAVSDGSDPDARWHVMMGAVTAAMTTWKGLGAAHALSVPFDDVGMHHGTVIGLVLPVALEHVLPACPAATVERLAGVIGCPATQVPAFFADFAARIGLPDGLGAAGVRSGQVEGFGAKAAGTAFNALSPRPADAATYDRLIAAAMNPTSTHRASEATV